MNKIILNGSTVALLSFTTIIVSFILVLTVGHKAIIDETIISLSIISIFLFGFLFYGFYKGIYIKNDVDYKLQVNHAPPKGGGFSSG